MRLLVTSVFGAGAALCLALAPLSADAQTNRARQDRAAPQAVDRNALAMCTRKLSESILETADPARDFRVASDCLNISLTERGVNAARARFYSGRAYSRIGQTDDAIRLLEAAVNTGQYFPEFAPELRASQLELAQAYLANRRIEAARNLLNSRTLSPGDPAVAFQRALLSLAELGAAGEEVAFDALKGVFTQDTNRLRGVTPGAPAMMSVDEIRRGRSWLFRLGTSQGQRALQLQGRDAEQRRSDAQRAIDFLAPVALAIDTACPDPSPVDCPASMIQTDAIGSLSAQPAPTREQLLDVFFQIGIAHLKAAGLQESPGLSGLTNASDVSQVGALDCVGSQLSADAAQHFLSARYAFEAYTKRSTATSASSADARWGLGCTILANIVNVGDAFERQRQVAQAIEQLKLAPRRPLTLLTIARAQILQGQPEEARNSFKAALDMSGAATRCQRTDADFSPANRDAFASRIYVEMARTRYASAIVRREAVAQTRDGGVDLYSRVISDVAAARPGSLRESEADLRCAIQLNFDNIEARLALGHIYIRLGADPTSVGAIDRPPFPKAGQVLQFFENRQSGTGEGSAEGLFLSSRRLTLAQQFVLASSPGRGLNTNDRTFLQTGERAVRFAMQAYSLSQREQYRRNACLAQILYGQTADPGMCAAAGQGENRAESLLYEGMYWLRRGQREASTEARLKSWSRSIQAFNQGVSAKFLGQTVTTSAPSLPPTIDLGGLLAYGQRYVLACRGINYSDGEVTSQDVKDFYRMSGIPLSCGGSPS